MGFCLIVGSGGYRLVVMNGLLLLESTGPRVRRLQELWLRGSRA